MTKNKKAKYITNRRFYIFYDKNDFVRCCGTAEQLVEDGFYKNTKIVSQVASRIRHGDMKGAVVVIPLVDA